MHRLEFFDPNKNKKFARPRWGTYIPGRRPEFKVHSNLGHAKNALHGARGRGGVLFEHNGDLWVRRLLLTGEETVEEVKALLLPFKNNAGAT